MRLHQDFVTFAPSSSYLLTMVRMQMAMMENMMFVLGQILVQILAKRFPTYFEVPTILAADEKDLVADIWMKKPLPSPLKNFLLAAHKHILC